MSEDLAQMSNALRMPKVGDAKPLILNGAMGQGAGKQTDNSAAYKGLAQDRTQNLLTLLTGKSGCGKGIIKGAKNRCGKVKPGKSFGQSTSPDFICPLQSLLFTKSKLRGHIPINS